MIESASEHGLYRSDVGRRQHRTSCPLYTLRRFGSQLSLVRVSHGADHDTDPVSSNGGRSGPVNRLYGVADLASSDTDWEDTEPQTCMNILSRCRTSYSRRIVSCSHGYMSPPKMATSSGLFLATIYNQSQLAERKHVARYWSINTAATAVLLSAHPSSLVITTKLAAAILGGRLFGGVLPAQYCPCAQNRPTSSSLQIASSLSRVLK